MTTERGNLYVRRNRARTRSANRAMRRLKECHPAEYRTLYQAERQREPELSHPTKE